MPGRSCSTPYAAGCEPAGRRPRGGDVTIFSARVRLLYADTTLPTYVDRQLRAIESLNKEITDADRELAATAKGDPIARRLMTVPGVGPSTSVRFVAALDETTHSAALTPSSRI